MSSTKHHWTEFFRHDYNDEEPPKRHWTEYLNNDDEATDRDDDWEWDRQDDFGDPWDQEDPPSE